MYCCQAGHSTQSRVLEGLGTTCYSSGCSFFVALNFRRHEQLEQALNEGAWSVDAWQKALDSLPKENLSPGELKQKEQYEAGIKAAREPRVIQISGAAGRMPWDYAKAMKPELINRKHEMAASSVSPSVPFFVTIITITNTIRSSSDLAGLGHPQCLRGTLHICFLIQYVHRGISRTS